MTLREITMAAGKLLPKAKEYPRDRIRIVLPKEDYLEIDITAQLDAPTEYESPYHEVEFRKRYVDHVVTGWQLVGLVNGI